MSDNLADMGKYLEKTQETAPPLIITRDEVDEMAAGLDKAITEVEAGL